MNVFKNILILALLLAILLLPSCMFDGDTIGNINSDSSDSITVKINLQMPTSFDVSPYAINDIDENYVKEIDILVQQSTMTDFYFAYRTRGRIKAEPSGGLALYVTLKRQGYFVSFYTIANAHDEIEALEEFKKEGTDSDYVPMSEIFEKLVSAKNGGKWKANNSNDFDAIPMWGVLQGPGTGIGISDNTLGPLHDLTTSHTVNMRHSLARLDVVLDEDVILADNFTLNKVYIYNSKKKGRIAPKMDSNYSILETVEPAGDINNSAPLEYEVPEDMKTAFEKSIYLYPASATGRSASEVTCVVVEGKYGDDADPSYYRLDFLDTDNKTYKDIRANHKYVMNIKKVSGRGYASANDAYNSNHSFNMEGELKTFIAASVNDVVFNNNNYISFDKGRTFNLKRIKNEQEVTINTDYYQGFKISKITKLENGIESEFNNTEDKWLETDKISGNVNTFTKISIITSVNNTGKDRTGFIYVQAGLLEAKITVNQEHTIAPYFATSNIVWDNSQEKLTFATNRIENTTIAPANSQGVLFKWGSLVAISPAQRAPSVYDYASSSIVHSPNGNNGYSWNAIPYLDGIEPPFDNYDERDDDFKTYNGGVGYKVSDAKGDICRYITAKGWVSGDEKWRLPTGEELKLLSKENPNKAKTGSWVNIIGTPSSPPTNNFGFYQIQSGHWLGAYVPATGNSIAAPTTGIFFPAGVYRHINNGELKTTELNGHAWSGSSATISGKIQAYYIYQDENQVPTNKYFRGYAFPIRCIRDYNK